MTGPKKKSIKDIIKSEYKKCAQDPVYFMKKYCKIQHPKKGKILFDLYPFQARTLEEFKQHRFNVILKSRQLGISTLSAGYALWAMTFNEDYNILVIATKQDIAKNLVTKVRVMQEGLPSWLKATTEEDNKLGMRFKNGSQIKAVSASADAGRSEALSLLIIDEAAFIRDIDEIWTSAQSTLSTGGSAIVLSTPNGVGNFFHKTWQKGERGEQWNPIKLHWTVHPERDQQWRDEQDTLLGEKKAGQECDCDFISSGHTVIDGDILQWYTDTHVKEPMEKRGIDQSYWIWEAPDYSRDYVVVADVARGDSVDYSAFHVMDVESMKQVASFKSRLSTTDFGHMLVSVATEWNNALLVIENASVGWAVCQIAIDRAYTNLYYTYKSEGYHDSEVYYQKGHDLKDKSQMVAGFSTTSRTRPLIISKLETNLREKTPIIQCKRTIDELFTFVWHNGRAEASPTYNDDLVMSLSICLWVRDTALRLRQQGIELSKSAISGITRHSGIYTSNEGQLKDAKWTMPTKDGDEDLRWLL